MRQKTIDIAFYVSILLKALNAALELALGALFLFTGAVGGIIAYLARIELIEDPTDFIAVRVMNWLPHLTSGAERFGAYYLLSHGAVKLFLVWALLKRYRWAYPAAIVVLGLFIVYQLARFAGTHSVPIIILTAFDLFVIWIIWMEYVTHIRRKKDRVRRSEAGSGPV